MAIERFRKRYQKIDYVLALVIFLLSVFGIVMVFSSSVVISNERFHNSYGYLTQQVTALVLGIIVMGLTTMIDYRVWRKYATHLLIITLVLLVAVFLPIIGVETKGAHRWVDVGFTRFQPSEIIKISFLLYVSAWLAKKGEGIKGFSSGFIPFVAILGLVMILIMKQPDMGTMSVIALAATAVFFVAGVPWAYLVVYIGGAAAALYGLILVAPYRLQRLMVFLDPAQSTQGAAYHINQAFLAIGSGGWFGLGFGQSRQKYLFLPEAHTDSIFAIICEELGLVRSILVIVLFVVVAWRGYKIAQKAPDTFARLVATGITTWFVGQAFINISAMLGILPLTGVTLPFISYGGTSLMVSLAAAGILLNISRQTV